MVILLAAMLALPGKPGHALLELEKDVDRAEAILASGHGSLERAAQLETSTDDMGGLTEEDDEVFSDLDYDGGA